MKKKAEIGVKEIKHNLFLLFVIKNPEKYWNQQQGQGMGLNLRLIVWLNLRAVKIQGVLRQAQCHLWLLVWRSSSRVEVPLKLRHWEAKRWLPEDGMKATKDWKTVGWSGWCQVQKAQDAIVAVLVTQSCLTLCSSVQGILQVRILEWVAILFTRGFSPSRGWTWVSCIAARFFTIWATGEAIGRILNSSSRQSGSQGLLLTMQKSYLVFHNHN